MIASLQRDLVAVHGQIATLRGDHAALKGEVVLNTAITRRIEANTQTIVEAVAGAGAMWDFLTLWAGRAKRWSFFTAKWVGVVAGAFVAVWSAANVLFHVDLSAWIVASWRGFWR